MWIDPPVLTVPFTGTIFLTIIPVYIFSHLSVWCVWSDQTCVCLFIFTEVVLPYGGLLPFSHELSMFNSLDSLSVRSQGRRL